MRAERLADPSLIVAYDSETHLIQPGLTAPPPVCASLTATWTPGRGLPLFPDAVASTTFASLLAEEKWTISGANVAFDVVVRMAAEARKGVDVAPEVFRAYDPTGGIVRGECDGRVYDVMLAEQLHHIAQGHLTKDPRTGRLIKDPGGDSKKDGAYSLASTTMLVTGRVDAKTNDRFRLRYAELEHVPFDQWPPEAKSYLTDDSWNTHDVTLRQTGHRPAVGPHRWRDDGRQCVCLACGVVLREGASDTCERIEVRRNLHNLSHQVYFGLAAALGDAWGFNVNQRSVDLLETRFGPEYHAAGQRFREAGLIRPNGTEDQSLLKRLVVQAYGGTEPCVDCGGTGKVPSEKTAGRTKVNCKSCDGTKLKFPPGLPRSESGQVAKDRDTLLESGDDFLMAYQEWGADKKIEKTYIPLLRKGRCCVRCGAHGTKKSPHKETCPVALGAEAPAWRDVPLCPRTRVLVETGRCAIADGLHGLPRKGVLLPDGKTKLGVRECFEARPGFVYSSTDYTAGELVALAEVCHQLVGFSELGKALIDGIDPHLAVAATSAGKSYDEMLALFKAKDPRAKDGRQAGKGANFGFGGYMQELTFTLHNRANPNLFTPHPNGPDFLPDRKGPDRNVTGETGWKGWNGLRTCILMDRADYCGMVNGRPNKIIEYHNKPCKPVCLACVQSGKRLRQSWMQQWREMDGLFKWVKNALKVVGPSGTSEITHLHSLRVRGGVELCDGANGLFQGLLADAAKAAFCQIQRECVDRSWRVRSSEMMTSEFDGGESPLYGSRAIQLMHDEPLCEHPESVAHEASHRASEIMVEAFRFRCPNHAKACRADPALARKLYKGMEPRWRDGGAKRAGPSDRLVPWEPS